MKTGKYMIYKFYNRGTDTYETEFFLPDDTFQRIAYRLLTIASYKEKGSQIAGVLYVDKESYLNARLNLTVEEYIDNDRYEQEVKQQYKDEIIENAKSEIEEEERRQYFSDLKKLMRNGFLIALLVGLSVNQATDVINYFRD